MCSGATLALDRRVTHAVLNERYHFNKQTSLDRDGRQCMSAGITYSYCRLRPVIRDTEQFLQVAMGMKQWDCVSGSVFVYTLVCLNAWPTASSQSLNHDRPAELCCHGTVSVEQSSGCSTETGDDTAHF